MKKISTKQMKIKLIKFINSRKNNSFEKTILLSKENNESKKYIRKIDIDLKNLIISKKRKIKSRVEGISGENNFKIKSVHGETLVEILNKMQTQIDELYKRLGGE